MDAVWFGSYGFGEAAPESRIINISADHKMRTLAARSFQDVNFQDSGWIFEQAIEQNFLESPSSNTRDGMFENLYVP